MPQHSCTLFTVWRRLNARDALPFACRSTVRAHALATVLSPFPRHTPTSQLDVALTRQELKNVVLCDLLPSGPRYRLALLIKGDWRPRTDLMTAHTLPPSCLAHLSSGALPLLFFSLAHAFAYGHISHHNGHISYC